MTGTFGRDHDNVDVIRRNNGFEMDAESVGNAENFSGMEIGFDRLFVKLALRFVGSQNVDPVGALGGLVWRHDDHAVGASLSGARAVGIETDDDFLSTVAEILGLGV